jgi:uncharacterized protein YjbJ (UPF0337 family)
MHSEGHSGISTAFQWPRLSVACHVHLKEPTEGRRAQRKRNIAMKQSTKDQVQGKFHEVKGKAKEKVGEATDNVDLQQQGQDEKVGGKIQKKIGQVEKVFEK